MLLGGEVGGAEVDVSHRGGDEGVDGVVRADEDEEVAEFSDPEARARAVLVLPAAAAAGAGLRGRDGDAADVAPEPEGRGEAVLESGGGHVGDAAALEEED